MWFFYAGYHGHMCSSVQYQLNFVKIGPIFVSSSFLYLKKHEIFLQTYQRKFYLNCIPNIDTSQPNSCQSVQNIDRKAQRLGALLRMSRKTTSLTVLPVQTSSYIGQWLGHCWTKFSNRQSRWRHWISKNYQYQLNFVKIGHIFVSSSFLYLKNHETFIQTYQRKF